jgi:7-cyano-7-deazaguanine synthase
MKKAVILLSGGMDSATVLAYAKQQGYQCYALSFRYGQRHSSELLAAKNLAKHFNVDHKVIDLDLSRFGGSALTDDSIDVPDFEKAGGESKIPVTYVPARNTVFLSVSLAWAEVLNAHDIFIGVNAVDYSGYPDCRPEFIEAFEKLANLATREAVEGEVRLKIHTPLIDLSKAEIIQLGNKLGVDYSQTITCYQANAQGAACGHCDACMLRKKGFIDAQVPDNTRYVS